MWEMFKKSNIGKTQNTSKTQCKSGFGSQLRVHKKKKKKKKKKKMKEKKTKFLPRELKRGSRDKVR